MDRPEISVVICTYNPDPTLLQRVYNALAKQTSNNGWEVIVVDNASTHNVPLPENGMLGDVSVRLVQERKPGLANARCAGFREAQADLVVCVDDDNVLASDYLAQALRFAKSYPAVGVFAGRAIGDFGTKPSWLHRYHLARYAIRDLGNDVLVAEGESWSPAEPFGAGMVLKRKIALNFARLIENAQGTGDLGRTGASLASGEDSLISRLAHRMGYQVAYDPALTLIHIITKERLTRKYLFELVQAQAKSRVVLDRICDLPSLEQPPISGPDWLNLMRRFMTRLRSTDMRECITHIFWDLGYWQASREPMTPAQVRIQQQLRAYQSF